MRSALLRTFYPNGPFHAQREMTIEGIDIKDGDVFPLEEVRKRLGPGADRQIYRLWLQRWIEGGPPPTKGGEGGGSPPAGDKKAQNAKRT